jgi:hypothetical protein
MCLRGVFLSHASECQQQQQSDGEYERYPRSSFSDRLSELWMEKAYNLLLC